MKTIKNAYEELNGDLNNCNQHILDTSHKGLWFHVKSGYYITQLTTEATLGDAYYQYVCTVEEFNNYKPAYTFASGQDVFIAQINTLAGVESQRYYIKESWCACGHQAEYEDLGLLFHTKEEAESKCRELIGLPPRELPVVLVDGECYQFEYLDKPFNDMYKGFYSARERRFIFNGGFVAADSCVNIKPLTVEK